MPSWDLTESVRNLREYLRIPSVHPDVQYSGCVEFLKKQAESLGLPVRVVEVVPNKPVVIISWQGDQPELSSIILNSHMDVVPVYEEHWTYPPFEAHITDDGWIYARGSQDMKGIGMMHIEAVRALKNSGVRLKRTVHLTFVPDEETGSYDGMRKFAETEEFQSLNAGFALDESMPSKEDEITVFYGERATIQFHIHCVGVPGHGSLLLANTAGEKLHLIMSKFFAYRAMEKKKERSGTWLGEVTSINLTMINGGIQINVLPESLSASFDVRMAPDIDHVRFEDMILSWCKEAGDGVTCEFVQKNPVVKNTSIDESNVFWLALKSATDQMGVKLSPVICPGATDARFMRKQGVPSLGFSPLSKTPMLLHAHDERIHLEQYLRGIQVFEKVLAAVANV